MLWLHKVLSDGETSLCIHSSVNKDFTAYDSEMTDLKKKVAKQTLGKENVKK